MPDWMDKETGVCMVAHGAAQPWRGMWHIVNEAWSSAEWNKPLIRAGGDSWAPWYSENSSQVPDQPGLQSKARSPDERQQQQQQQHPIIGQVFISTVVEGLPNKCSGCMNAFVVSISISYIHKKNGYCWVVQCVWICSKYIFAFWNLELKTNKT